MAEDQDNRDAQLADTSASAEEQEDGRRSVVSLRSEAFQPDPTHQFGNMDTSGTTGSADSQIKLVTPVFEAHRAQALANAKRAVDPEDTDVDESSAVVLPPEAVTADDARQRIRDAATGYEKDPVEVEDPTLSDAKTRAESEEGTDVEAERKANSDAGGTGTGGGPASGAPGRASDTSADGGAEEVVSGTTDGNVGQPETDKAEVDADEPETERQGDGGEGDHTGEDEGDDVHVEGQGEGTHVEGDLHVEDAAEQHDGEDDDK